MLDNLDILNKVGFATESVKSVLAVLTAGLSVNASFVQCITPNDQVHEYCSSLGVGHASAPNSCVERPTGA